MSTASTGNEPKLDRAALAALYEETFRNLEEGTITEGRVVALTKDKVVVDIGYKSEGMIPSDQFSSDDLQALKVGDSIQVYIEECEDADGNLVLSKEKADKMKIWEELEKLFNEEKSIDGKIISRIKGGMMVDIGVKAFLPGSQIDLHPVRDLDGLVGKTFPLKIIKINHRRGNVVVSRRVLLEETRDKKRQTTLANLKEGQLIQGMVKNITDYGAFIDLGGIDGLLHITDMSWGRVGHPSEMFTVGDRVEVNVLKYDRETGRISLGLKQKSADPWTNVAGKYPIGTRVRGRVVSLTDYGAFIELEPGVEGLVHVSEMSWTHEVRHPSRVVTVGDQVVVPLGPRMSVGVVAAFVGTPAAPLTLTGTVALVLGHAGASVLGVGMAWLVLRRQRIALPRRDWPAMVLLALVGVAVFQACWGLGQASSMKALVDLARSRG
mgnify:CR=1 FL=1